MSSVILFSFVICRIIPDLPISVQIKRLQFTGYVRFVCIRHVTVSHFHIDFNRHVKYCNDPAVSVSSQVHYGYLFIADLCVI